MACLQLLRRLTDHARQRPDAIAYRSVNGGPSISWAELARAVRFCADRFSQHLKPGQTLLISGSNCPQVAIAALAGFAAGLRVFPVSPELSEPELVRLAQESNATAGVCSARAKRILEGTIAQIWMIDKFSTGSDPQTEISFENSEAGDLILQSSGTTGFPRLVLRRGHSIDAVSSAMVNAIGFGPEDSVLALLPLSHSYGFEHGLLAPVWAGSTVLLGQGLDIHALTRELAGGATILPTVPSVIEVLSDLPAPACEMPGLREIYSAGGPLPKCVFDRFHARFGRRVSQLYGATEVGSVTFNPAGDAHFDPAGVGRPMAGVEIRILDQLEPDRILRSGQEGQVAIRAASMFEGYLDGDGPIVDGYFLTGDLGTLDRWGRLTVTGRLKLLIDVGGVKVNPLEVESVIREHPEVGMCVVVPVKQSETVYRVKAIATPRDPNNPPSVEELRKLVRQRLATYKIPRMIEIRASLPTTATGKVLRHLVEKA